MINPLKKKQHSHLGIHKIWFDKIIYLNQSAAEITFPDYVTVARDDTAFFTCSILLTDDEAGQPHGILWTYHDNYRRQQQIASNDNITDNSGKYSLNGCSISMSTAITQTLSISSDDVESCRGTYQCIFLLNKENTGVEASARLYIEDFVDSPYCGAPFTNIFSPGEQITLGCYAEPGDPAIQMIWSQVGGANLTSTTQQSHEVNFIPCTYTFVVPENIDSITTYKCTVTNVLGTDVKSCNFPLMVVNNPQNLTSFIVIQTPEIALEGQDVMFIWFASDKYSFNYRIDIKDEIIRTYDNRILTIYNVQSNYDGLNITLSFQLFSGGEVLVVIAIRVANLLTSATLLTTTPTSTTLQTTTPTSTTLQTTTPTSTTLQTTLVSASGSSQSRAEPTSSPTTSSTNLMAMSLESSFNYVTLILIISGTIILFNLSCIAIWWRYKTTQREQNDSTDGDTNAHPEQLESELTQQMTDRNVVPVQPNVLQTVISPHNTTVEGQNETPHTSNDLGDVTHTYISMEERSYATAIFCDGSRIGTATICDQEPTDDHLEPHDAQYTEIK